MDLTTILGIFGIFGLGAVVWVTGQVSSAFLNAHGLTMVIGGALVAILVNTPLPLFLEALRALFVLFRRESAGDPREIVPVLVTASQNVHARGINALAGMDPAVAGGFLARAAQIAMEFKDPVYVNEVLGAELARENEHHNEIVNVYRTLSVLFPMFGLIGTLFGIVHVLRNLGTDPGAIGPAMAVAITSAFYGISFANLFAVPVAGKLRIKFRQELFVKSVIAEAVVEMLKGTAPVLVERRLESALL